VVKDEKVFQNILHFFILHLALEENLQLFGSLLSAYRHSYVWELFNCSKLLRAKMCKIIFEAETIHIYGDVQ